MEKPILATNIDGLLIKHEAFTEPHKSWFDKAIKLTKDKTLEKYKGIPNYFEGVNIAMEKIMPNATKEQRTLQARIWYQEAIIEYIKQHPEVINKKVIASLKKIKSKFKLALITTNTKEYISKILEVANLNNIYEIVFATSAEQEPSKEELFKNFVEKYGKPKYYLASRSKDGFEECKKLGISSIYLKLEDFNEELSSIANKTIRLDELEDL